MRSARVPTDPTCTAELHLTGRAHDRGCRCPEAIEAIETRKQYKLAWARRQPTPVDLAEADEVLIERLIEFPVRLGQIKDPTDRVAVVAALVERRHTQTSIARHLHISGATAKWLLAAVAASRERAAV